MLREISDLKLRGKTKGPYEEEKWGSGYVGAQISLRNISVKNELTIPTVKDEHGHTNFVVAISFSKFNSKTSYTG